MKESEEAKALRGIQDGILTKKTLFGMPLKVKELERKKE
jgi:hypothetical protein